VKQYRSRNFGTGDAKEMLGLSQEPENNVAGNLYSVALSIIVKLQDEANRPDPRDWALNSGDGVYRP
jgi:hypothetical protein